MPEPDLLRRNIASALSAVDTSTPLWAREVSNVVAHEQQPTARRSPIRRVVRRVLGEGLLRVEQPLDQPQDQSV